jgi:uncharacterized tellurite resistance protein B-like protein
MDPTQISLASLELNKLEAMIEIMLLAAYADGSFSEAERAEFDAHLMNVTEGRLSAAIIDSLVAHHERSLREYGRADRFASIRARLPDTRMREAAIELAIHLVAADGVIHDSEHAMLVRAAEALDVPLAIKGRVMPISTK